MLPILVCHLLLLPFPLLAFFLASLVLLCLWLKKKKTNFKLDFKQKIEKKQELSLVSFLFFAWNLIKFFFLRISAQCCFFFYAWYFAFFSSLPFLLLIICCFCLLWLWVVVDYCLLLNSKNEGSLLVFFGLMVERRAFYILVLFLGFWRLGR